jgi:hypothetical protein
VKWIFTARPVALTAAIMVFVYTHCAPWPEVVRA